MNAPKNKSVFDILVMRKRRLDAALVMESKAIEKFTNFCIAKKSALHAQSATVADALTPASGVVGTTTTTTVSFTPSGIFGKKIMKRKLPEPRDGWKDHSVKTHRVHYDTIQYHKTVLDIFKQIIDIVHE